MEGVEVKEVWKEVNGEERVFDPSLYEKWRESIAGKREVVADFVDGFSDYGHFINKLVCTATGLWIEREWIPAKGYAWSESQLYAILFPSEQ